MRCHVGCLSKGTGKVEHNLWLGMEFEGIVEGLVGHCLREFVLWFSFEAAVLVCFFQWGFG